jgi:disulfide bond formation protein DsbB
MGTEGTGESSQAAGSGGLAWLACGVALLASIGSVYLSVGMGLKACPLCFYQRTFAFAAFGVLLVGLLTGAQRTGLSLLTLPLAVGGLGVAVFHVFLEVNGTLECPRGLLGLGTPPRQSLVVFVALTALLVLAVLSEGAEKGALATVLAGTMVLGAVFAVAAIVSAPPLPPERTTAYPPNSLDTCRRPFHADSR